MHFEEKKEPVCDYKNATIKIKNREETTDLQKSSQARCILQK